MNFSKYLKITDNSSFLYTQRKNCLSADFHLLFPFCFSPTHKQNLHPCLVNGVVKVWTGFSRRSWNKHREGESYSQCYAYDSPARGRPQYWPGIWMICDEEEQQMVRNENVKQLEDLRIWWENQKQHDFCLISINVHVASPCPPARPVFPYTYIHLGPRRVSK